MSNPCIFFTSSNCWQTLVLASSPYSSVMGSGGMCTPCTNAQLLAGYSTGRLETLDGNRILMSGARPQYTGML